MYKDKLSAYERAVEALKCFTEALNILGSISLSQSEIDIIAERLKWLMANERHARLELIEAATPKGVNGEGV